MERCVGCNIRIGKTGTTAHYCKECAAKLGSVGTQVKRIMVSAGVKLESGMVCVDCGRLAEMYDHRYYSRPLDVEPVCRGCNRRRGPARDIADVLRNGLLYVPTVRPTPEALGIPHLELALDEYERQILTKALQDALWNRTKAARALGITFRAMRYRMERLKIA